jgi:glutamate-1-semialdehyde 2,1-aminomutase
MRTAEPLRHPPAAACPAGWRDRLGALHAAEAARFLAARPRSRRLAEAASRHLLFGVPLHWMSDGGTPLALQVARARGAELEDLDGHVLDDFCLGDTGAMFGHAPAAVVRALGDQAAAGMTAMLPGEDAAAVGALLADRFGLPLWQFALSATDANRFVLRWLRAATGRTRLLVFDGCYHGTLADTFVDLVDGRPQPRASVLGEVRDLRATTTVIPFNDLAALQAALAGGDIACLLAEPVMTNIGMVLPAPGYWEAARALLDRHDVPLVLDETHTLSSGPGGWGRAHGLRADALVVGKAIGGGVSAAAYGFSARWAARAEAAKRAAPPGHSGIGTTLSANLLAMAAMRATLEHLLVPSTFAAMQRGCHAPGRGPARVLRPARPALVRDADRRAHRVPVPPHAPARRGRGRRRARRGAERLDPPRPGQPRRADLALPPDDAGEPGDPAGRDRAAAGGLRRPAGLGQRLTLPTP